MSAAAKPVTELAKAVTEPVQSAQSRPAEAKEALPEPKSRKSQPEPIESAMIPEAPTAG